MPLEKQCTPKTKKKIIQNLKDWDLFIRDQGTKLQNFEYNDLDLEGFDSVKSFDFDLEDDLLSEEELVNYEGI